MSESREQSNINQNQGGVRLGPGRGPGHGPHGPGGGMMPGEKAKDFKGTIGKLLAYMGGFKYAIFAVMLFAA